MTLLACALFLTLGLLGAASDDAPPLTLNLAFGDMTEAPPAAGITSGGTFGLSVTVLLTGDDALTSDPLVEVSLRRWDKPEACVTEVGLVPAAILMESRAYTVSFAIDTTGLSGGSYEVVATIEYDGVEVETIDNRRILGTLILLDPKPELHPVELSLDPAIPLQWGETATVHTTIANTGRLAAGGLRVVFEICSAPDDDECAAWTEFASRLIPGLARNDEIRVSVPLDIVSLFGSSAVEGTYPLRVRVVYPASAAEGEAAELDTGNNVMLTSVRIGSSTLGLPDLVPLTLTFDENLPLHWDNTMVAIATIANIGGSATGPDGFRVRFSCRQVGESEWVELDEERISDGLGIDVSFNQTNRRTVDTTIGPLPPGEYELLLGIDSGGAVDERNESNNDLIVGFSVRGTELQAQGIELPSAEIHQGDSLIVRASVVNTGDRPATDFSVGFYLDGERFDTFFYVNEEGLLEYESMQAQGVLDTHDVPPGEYDLRVIVDPDDRIPEFDEGNNTAAMPIRIGEPARRRAELHITDVRLDPASPIAAGEHVSCSVEVRNAGEIDTEPVRLVLAYAPCVSECLDGSLDWEALDGIATRTELLIPGLERGEARRYVLPITTDELPLGAYELRALIDAEDAVLEMDESNNVITVTFRIGEGGTSGDEPADESLANLKLLNLSVEPPDPCDEPVIELRGTVQNEGPLSTGEFLLSYRWIDPYGNQYELGVELLEGLQAGASRPFSRAYDTTSFPPGVHQAFVVVDPDGRIPERDETDNHARVDVAICGEIQALPDIAVTAVRFDSPDGPLGEGHAVEPGQRLYAYATVRNAGNVPSGPFSVSFETPLGIGTETWTSVGPLDQVEVSHPLPTDTTGTFQLTVTVDPDGLIPEVAEANNTIPNGYVAELPSYVVRPAEVAAPVAVIPPSTAAGAARWLQADSTGDSVYVVFAGGSLRRIDPASTVADIISLGEEIVDVEWSLGSAPAAYVGTADGTVHCIGLETGAVIAEASLSPPVVALARGSGVRLYVAVDGGFHELTVAGSEFVVSRRVEVSGEVLDIDYDAERATVYVLSTEGVFAFDDALQLMCSLDADELVGTPAVLTLAGSGIYLGTDSGTGGIVYAASHCTLAGGTEGRMLVGWRYPRLGTLPGSVASIVIDPRDIDPIYVATRSGAFYSLGFDGSPLWEYVTGRSIGSTPLADKRSGRVFFGDDGGVPHILTLDGTPAFEIDLAGGVGGGAIRSTLVVVETRERTELGTRFVRNYYYGTESGAVYRIASQQ